MRRAALGAFALGVLVLGALVVVPFLTDERAFPAQVMVPWPGFGPVDKLPPRATLCIAGVTAERHGEMATVVLNPYHRAGPRLVVALEAPGYRARGSISGGYRRVGAYAAPVRAPAHDTQATACIHNAGRRKVGLYAYPNPAVLGSRVIATRNGQRLDLPPVFGLWESGAHSVADRLSVTLQRIARFRGPLGHAWLVTVALLLAVAGLIGGFGGALALSMRGDSG